jgi:leucyl-tRNA synthetase
MIHCESCDLVPVPEEQLPVKLPADLDWTLGANALAFHRAFTEVECPACGQPAKRETDTLDCFFDDIWCQLSPLIDLASDPDFRTARTDAWLPVDRFHSGFDTVAYLHLHRFLGAVLHEHGQVVTAEPIGGHPGHEMVLTQGRKMSKHLGNAVSPTKLVRRHGADALRLTVLWAARPSAAIDWHPGRVDRAVALLRSIHDFFSATLIPRLARLSPQSNDWGNPSKAFVSLSRRAEKSLQSLKRFVEEYRPNAAIEGWVALFVRTERFATPRIESARLSDADAAGLRELAAAELIALSLFAPHLAEELWHRLGHQTYVVQAPWPGLEDPGQFGTGNPRSRISASISASRPLNAR